MKISSRPSARRVRRGGLALACIIVAAAAAAMVSRAQDGAPIGPDRAGFAPRPLVDAGLTRVLQQKGSADTLVFLREQADLSGAERIADRAERIGFVYDRLRATAERTQGRAIDLLKRDGAEHRALHIVNALWVPKASAELIERLQGLPEIAELRLNPTIRAEERPLPSPRRARAIDPASVPENLRAIGADRVWSELRVTGEGIVVGIADGGFHWRHGALRPQYRGSLGLSVKHDYSWHDAVIPDSPGSRPEGCRPPAAEPCDETGHGTHVTGTVVGAEPGGRPLGVAPGARWIACRNMLRGAGTAGSYLGCFEFFLSPYPRGGNPRTEGRPELAPHVVNNSWRCPSSEGCKGDEFIEAVRALRAAGIFVVASAGNNGPGCGSVDGAPGFYSGELMAVGAFDPRGGGITDFSSRGPSKWNGQRGVSLTAPGEEIRSSIPGSGGRDSYEGRSGTSMAAPHVTGAVALLWSARPELIGDIAGTTELLERTAEPARSSQSCGSFAGSAVPNAVFGAGRLNVHRAILSAGQTSPR